MSVIIQPEAVQEPSLRPIFSIPQGPLANICSFLCDTRLSELNQAFKRANLSAMRQEEARLQIRDKVSAERVAMAWEELGDRDRPLEEVVQGMSLEVRGIQNRLDLPDIWGKILESLPRWLQGGRRDHLVAFLAQVKAIITPLLRQIDAPQPRALGLPLVDEFQKCLNDFVMRDSLPERLERIFARDDGLRLENLHANQKEAVDASRDLARRFARIAHEQNHLFSYERFMRTEDAARVGEALKDSKIERLWRSIRLQVGVGPVPFSSAAEIRAWMNNRANAAHLAQVTHLQCTGFLPPEARFLNGLRFLEWQGEDCPLTELPHWFGLLGGLERLVLQAHDFAEVPAELEHFPALESIEIRDNLSPIRALPDWLYERLNGFTTGFPWEWMEDDMQQIHKIGRTLICSPHERSDQLRERFAYLRQPPLAEIPFRLWFQETIRMPNIFLILCSVVMQLVTLPILLISENLMRNPIVQIAMMIFALPFLIPGAILSAINHTLNYALEPVVTFIRDQMGYSRMVRLRDLPAPAQ